MLSDDQKRLLDQDLPHDAVRQRRQGGGSVSYVDGWYVITRLNAVFGFDGWSLELGAVALVAAGERTVVHVPATLRAAGVARSDVGVAITAGASPDALETALKGAATDALKRCARTFGASLGLALYDKEQRTVGVSGLCRTLLDELATVADIEEWASRRRRELDGLPADEKTEVREAFVARRKQAGPAFAAPSEPPQELPAPLPDLASATSLDHLAALLVAAGPAVPADRKPELWRAATARAGELGEASEIFKRRVEAAARAGDSAAWSVVAQVLGELASSTDVAATAKAHAAAYGKLPRPLQEVISLAASARRKATRPDPVTELLVAIGRSTTEDELKAQYARLQALAASKGCTKDDALRVTEALNECVAILGEGQAA